MDTRAAQLLAERHLAESLPLRWQHSQMVAATAAEYAGGIGLDPAPVVAAAWLHDVGYAPALRDTGFHPVDGARFLRREGWPDQVVDLVAHHSCSRVEAGLRGLTSELAEFEDVPGTYRDVLWASDATTGPDGTRLDVKGRVCEVVERYGRGSLVGRCMLAIAPELEAAVKRVTRTP
ncbi:HD domain-containing protein [Modestobacter muralis]|nr:HD domain-containing protein [Modestobacter muralis]